MKALLLLTIKNLKLLIRAKWSALIIIFAPLLLMLILGLSYNTSSQYDLKIGIYSTSFTEDVNSFISLLEKENYKVIRYDKSVDDCLKDIKSNLVHTCISIPSSLKIEENVKKEIVFYIDQSRINIVWMIQETVKDKFNIQSQQISQGLTQNILGKLSDTKTTLDSKQSEITSAKEKSSSASSTISATKASLSSIDFSYSEKDYNTSVVLTLETGIAKAKGSIAEAKSAVNGAGLEDTQEEEISATLNEANTALDDLLKELKDNSTGVGSIIASLNKDLTEAKTKLSAASKSIKSGNAELDTAVATIQESSSTLESVQQSLANLKNSIEGVKVTDADIIASPLTTRIEPIVEKGTYLNYLFPSLLVLVLMFSSLLLGTTLVLMERNSPAFLRNFFLPIHKITFISSMYLTNLVINIVQIAIILGISLIFLEDASSRIPQVALILLLVASIFTFIGMVIGYIFNTEETGVLASISLGSLFLLFSGMILPLESVSAFIRGIASFNPFVLAERLVREIFLFGSPLDSLFRELGILGVYALVLFIAIIFIESFLHQHYVRRFLKHHHRAHRQKDKRNRNDA